MTHEEAKQAYLDMTPVWLDGIEYAYILARKIQRDKDGKHVMLLELMDKCNHSITVSRVERVSLTPPKPPCGRERLKRLSGDMPLKRK